MKDFRINDSVEELRVIANTSSMPYAGQDQSGTEIGRILGVHGVLTGRVRRAAERFRVNIELLNVETGEITWANSFDADLTLENVLDVQERIAAAVAREMQVLIRELETPESRPTSLVALDAYNDGLYHSNLIIMGEMPFGWMRNLVLRTRRSARC